VVFWWRPIVFRNCNGVWCTIDVRNYFWIIGIVVLSKSHISVSGPAAGLTAIILTAITDFGAFDIF
jgi:hypothetical protein